MTRETKAGLVVSGSFLCLVGLVFYSKLQSQGSGWTGAHNEAASVEAPADPVPISENENPQAEQQTTGFSSGTPWKGGPSNESMNVASTGGDGGKLNSDGSLSVSQEKSTDSGSGKNVQEDSSAGGYQIPAPAGDEKTNSNSSTDVYSSDPSVKEKSSKKTDTEVDVGAIQEKNEQRDIPKASLSLNVEEHKKQAIKHSETGSTNPDKSELTSSKETSTTSTQQASDSAAPAEKKEGNTVSSNADLEPPPVPSQYKDKDPYHTLPKDPPKAVSSSPASPSPAPARYVRDQGLKKAAPSEAPGIKLHVPENNPGTSQVKGVTGADARAVSGPTGSGLQTPGVMPSPLLTPPPAGDTAPEPHVLLGKPTPSAPSSNQVAQGPAEGQQNSPGGFVPAPQAALTNPPYIPPGKPGQPGPIVPRVESYDEETYVCKAGDTFAGISSRYYYTDKYALALLRFNRNHPRAAVGIAQDPPALQAGQAIFIPPLRILEKQYLLAPAGSNAVIQTAPALPRETMPPTVPPVTVPPGKSWSTPSGERTYQVPEKGEMFLEVAKKTLGNADRWGEIWRLNPQYDPKYIVPAGTNLRLPADARVETSVPEKKQPASEPKSMPVYPN